MTIGRVIAVAVLIIFAVFAWQGGVFSVSGYRELEHNFATAQADSIHLRHEIDSLLALRDSLRTNPVVQERVAREQWGLIRKGEISVLIHRKDSM